MFSSLKIEYYWCPQSGYHHALELVCPDEDLADADWCAQKFEEEEESLKSEHNYGDEYDKYLGYFLPKNRPEKGREFAALSAGGWHSLGLGPTGRVYGWGRDRRGQASPSGSIAAQSIAAGDWHGLALKNDGSVVGWGHDEHGQATPPEGLQGGLALAAGEYHSLALLNNGTVVGWGNNDHGQITPPEGLGGVIAIAAGESHSLALLSNGTVVGWGKNSLGQAQPPENLQGVVALAAGGSHSLALLSNGTVIGWGSNSEGQGPASGRLTRRNGHCRRGIPQPGAAK